MIEDIDYLGREWGKWMRYQPNGWPSRNHITKLKKISFASGNSYAPMAVTSDSLDTLDQKSYHPTRKNIWSGELKLGAGNWQISASGTSAAVYGALRKNPSGGRIKNFRIYRSKILIKRFMPEDVLRFHRAWTHQTKNVKHLHKCHQTMLWTHYVLKAARQQKVELLRTTTDRYPKWLERSQRAISSIIAEHDAELSSKKSPPSPVAARNKGSTGPLCSCRIFASIHKFPIRHSNVKDHLPVSFSPQGIRNPRTPADYFPADKSANPLAYMYFRQPTGEIYSVLSPIDLKRLRRKGELDSFLDERRENAANFTNFDIDEWYPVIWHPGWIKPVPHYNALAWMKERGLTLLDECATDWGEELRAEKKRLWKRGGRELGWYL
ncbi:hypothetical protein IH824_01325 [candidate division KSB1 bacterium]|nr:hypothetical protein [candidate division KSB1 bacterium]